jgi:hypothetical protein
MKHTLMVIAGLFVFWGIWFYWMIKNIPDGCDDETEFHTTKKE